MSEDQAGSGPERPETAQTGGGDPHPAPAPGGPGQGMVALHFQRGFRAGMAGVGVAPDELAWAGGNERVARLVGWRRSVLWTAAALAVLAWIFKLISFISSASELSGDETLRAIFTDGIYLYEIVPLLGITGLLFGLGMAAKNWNKPRVSRRFVRIGVAIAIGAPIFIMMLPMMSIGFDWQGAREYVARQQLDPNSATVVLGMTGLIAAIMMFVQAIPPMISLFPGLTRAGLALKSAYPQQAIPAVAACIAGVIGGAFFLAMLALIQQVMGTFPLALGILFLSMAPMFVGLRALGLAKPMDAAEGRKRVASVRLGGRIFLGVGLVCIIGALAEVRFMGTPLLDMLEWHALLQIAIGYVASALAVMIIGVDLLLESMIIADRRSVKIHGGEPVQELEELREALEVVETSRLARAFD